MWPPRWAGSRSDARCGVAADQSAMTNAIAIGLVLLVGGLIALDLLWFGWDLHIFLGRKFVDLIEYLAIWR